MICQLQISKQCKGRAEVYSGLAEKSCCEACADKNMKRWQRYAKKVKDVPVADDKIERKMEQSAQR